MTESPCDESTHVDDELLTRRVSSQVRLWGFLSLFHLSFSLILCCHSDGHTFTRIPDTHGHNAARSRLFDCIVSRCWTECINGALGKQAIKCDDKRGCFSLLKEKRDVNAMDPLFRCKTQ